MTHSHNSNSDQVASLNYSCRTKEYFQVSILANLKLRRKKKIVKLMTAAATWKRRSHRTTWHSCPIRLVWPQFLAFSLVNPSWSTTAIGWNWGHVTWPGWKVGKDDPSDGDKKWKGMVLSQQGSNNLSPLSYFYIFGLLRHCFLIYNKKLLN